MTKTDKKHTVPEPIPVDTKKLIDALGTIFDGVVRLLKATEPGIAKELADMAINGVPKPAADTCAEELNLDDFEEIIAELESLIKGRENRLHQNVRGNQIPAIIGDTMEDTSQVICPIISAGDVLGAVLLLGRSKKQLLGELELKIASVAAGFLGKQMEQ